MSKGWMVVSVFLFAGPLAAQDATGRIIGSITDPQGGVVVGAKVTATQEGTRLERTATSDETGQYQILHVPIGAYQVAAESPGFRRGLVSNQALQINQSLRVDLRLEVGAVTEVINVDYQTAGVETVVATIGASITNRPITDMPLNGRSVLDLALLQPGVTEARPNLTGAGRFTIAGGRSDSVLFLLDGGINNNLLSNGVVLNPNPDTVAEFRILSNNYTAEYGRNAGGVISVVTKSGTNQWHGTAYDYARNEALNANRFFNNLNGRPRPILKRHQFGGTLGGKIITNKLFFFGAYQGQRQNRLIANSAITVYTPPELRGDFSQSGPGGTPDRGVAQYLVRNPYFQPNPELASRAILDPGRIHSVAQSYIRGNLIPSSPSGRMFSQGGERDDLNETTGKLDWYLNDRDRLSVTLGWNDRAVLDPFWRTISTPGFETQRTQTQWFGNLTYTRTFSAFLLNELRFTPQRFGQGQALPVRKLPTPGELGFRTTPDRASGPPILYFFNSGFDVGFSPNGPTTFANNTYTLSDTVTWTRGRHNFKFGGAISVYQNNTVYDFYVNGQFVFSGPSGNGGIGSGNDRADFLLGLPDNYFQAPSAPSDIRSKYYSWFAQDEWRISRRLVLTLGLRYDYSQPKFDTQGRSFSIVPGARSQRFANAPAGMLFPGDSGAPKGANFPDRNDLAPRFGFALDPRGDGKTSIRGGFGIFYDILKGEDNLQFNGQLPFFGTADLYPDPLVVNPSREPLALSNPFAAVGAANPFPSRPPARDLNFGPILPIGGGGVFYVDPHLRTPYIMQYNLSVQRELLRNTTAEVNYLGSLSRKLTGLYDQNPIIPGATRRVLGDSFSFLDTFANLANGNYNSLQASVTRRPSESGPLGTTYFTLGYTFAKSLDTSSGFRSINQRVPAYDRRAFYAVSDFDINHRVVLSGGWDLPFARSSRGLARFPLRGWSLYPIISYRTGFPMDFYARISRTRTRPGPSGAGDPNLVRPDLIASAVTFHDPKPPQSIRGRVGNYWFDPTAFSTARFGALGNAIPTPEARTYGTFGRNGIRGPGRFNTDFSLAKRTRIGERLSVEARADFFNLFNNAQWDLPNLVFTSGFFGQVTTTAEPRLVQLALRVQF